MSSNSQPVYLQLLALAALAAAVTACAAPDAAPGSTAAKPLTCAQQYQAWTTGPANAPGKKLEADASALTKTAGDIPVITSDLKALGADATAMEAYPMPACADPAGYWQEYLSVMKAAGDNAGSASGLGGLLLAEAALKQAPAIQSKLSAELAKTAGVKAPAAQAPVTVPAAAPATVPALPTLATVAPVAVPPPSPLPTLATMQPVATS